MFFRDFVPLYPLSWVKQKNGVELLALFNSIPVISVLGMWFWKEVAGVGKREMPEPKGGHTQILPGSRGRTGDRATAAALESSSGA